MCPSRGDLLGSSFFWASFTALAIAALCIIIPCRRNISVHDPLSYFTEGLTLTLVKQKKLVVIGVLSAQNNFHRRQAIRDTWGKLVDGEEVSLKFIVGSESCPVPPADRATPYGCEEWTPVVSNATLHFTVTPTSHEVLTPSYSGFTFIVNQNISIVQLSVSSSLLTSAHRIARVVVVDAFRNRVVTSATFAFDPQVAVGVLRSKNVPPVRLPVNFEGELRVISSSTNNSCQFKLQVPNAVHVFELLDTSGRYFPLTTVNGSSSVCGGFSYSVENVEPWVSHQKGKALRRQIWDEQRASLKSELIAENGSHGDILSPQLVDVYANLTRKTMFFLEWAASNKYDFVLKTDDDVFLDVPKIVGELRRSKSKDSWDWWSCFKIGWPAPNAGKWRDRVSDVRTYPTFPSGSGYVIRLAPLLKMLGSPFRRFHVGEDVGVGMMAEELDMVRWEDSACYWSCNENCSKDPCNAPELSLELMKAHWESYKVCNEICGCTK